MKEKEKRKEKERERERLGPQRGLQTHRLFHNPTGRASQASYSRYCSGSPFYAYSCLNEQTNARKVFAAFTYWTVVSFKDLPYSSFSAQRIDLKGQAGLNWKKSKQGAQVAHWVDVLQSYQRLPLHSGERLAYSLVI